MDMDLVMDMVVDTMDTMVRGQLRQSQDMDTMAMDMVMGTDMAMATATMDIMARGLLMLKLSQLPLLNQAMAIMVMVMVTILAMDMDMGTMDTMAKDLLRLSLAMDIMAMDMDMGMDTAMVMDTMDKQRLKLEFSTNEVGFKMSLVKHSFLVE